MTFLKKPIERTEELREPASFQMQNWTNFVKLFPDFWIFDMNFFPVWQVQMAISEKDRNAARKLQYLHIFGGEIYAGGW